MLINPIAICCVFCVYLYWDLSSTPVNSNLDVQLCARLARNLVLQGRRWCYLSWVPKRQKQNISPLLSSPLCYFGRTWRHSYNNISCWTANAISYKRLWLRSQSRFLFCFLAPPKSLSKCPWAIHWTPRCFWWLCFMNMCECGDSLAPFRSASANTMSKCVCK